MEELVIRRLTYQIEEKDDNRTVQNFLCFGHGYSRRILINLKKTEMDITCNDKHIRMIDRLHTGDILSIILREQTQLKPNFELSVPIVYEDEDVIVYHKPPFMAIHPSNIHLTDTLANVFCAHMQHLNIDATFHSINRLDRDTSGLCVVAKNKLATTLIAQTIEKEYTAIVCGKVVPSVGRIDAPIAKVDGSKMKRCVDDKGQQSITDYRVIRETENYSLVRISLKTGRTHQIRVHFAHIGHPLAGDSMYGGNMTGMKRQALCCNKVSFIQPILHKRIKLCIDMQQDMHNLVQYE